MAYKLLSTMLFLLLTMSKPNGVTPRAAKSDSDSTTIQEFLNSFNEEASNLLNQMKEAQWAYAINITDHNEEIMVQEEMINSDYALKQARAASKFKLDGLDDYLKRQLVLVMDIGDAAQTDKEKVKLLSNVMGHMTAIYNKASVCFSKTECLQLEPGLTRLLAKSRDYDRLLAAWKGWRDATGPKIKPLFETYVALKNEAIRMLGHKDTGAYWRSWYDTPTFEDDVHNLFSQVRPLYEQLHAYVRRRLMTVYGADRFPSSGHIPAHLLGNMWAQSWDSLIDMMKPFKNKESMDVTDRLVEENFTVPKLFQTADAFFQSLGLIKLPKTFWEKSMFEKPNDDREVVCHASSWDFQNGKDFRIKMCTDITQHDFVKVHHQVGLLQYYMQYKDQPIIYREGANPGFPQAVGGTIALSVQTPKHMYSIGVLKALSYDKETDINFLMAMALERVAFLPFGYLIDQYRWGVFRGDTGPQNYTKHWWDLRCRHQGVSSPIPRSNDDFDPAAKFHIIGDETYIKYFVSFVMQFQFLKAMCQAAGHSGPLHHCDISNQKAAGRLLSKMMKLGSSKPWPEAMYHITGQTKMDAKPLMDYFQPLMNFLRKDNRNDYGWDPHCPKGTNGPGGMGMIVPMNGARIIVGQLWWPLIVITLSLSMLVVEIVP